ncbi:MULTISPECIES: SphA family protein [Roseobacteraceae]|uniref:Transporter n=1 Tax=Falsiruegeria litorea TaxID=1280831 RepID=A0ABS5WWZ1_9RHOB|nr:transporter [Phaeobacter gallaeciensis]MBT3143649.1 transporter [Falsiruegeria litorea]MBT8169598.1 transporter [Falsiruegeria litorea]
MKQTSFLVKLRKLRVLLGLSLMAVHSHTPVYAGEGAFSNYFPGAYGSLLPGMAPEPGYVFANVNLLYSGKANRAVSEGKINTSMESKAFYALFQGLHVWDAPALGGRFAVGGYLPLGYASYSSSVGGFSRSQDEFAFGDMGIIPASFYWSSGNFHSNLYGLIIAPTGEYDTGNLVNIGRNYWSLDLVAAMTWFNPDSGTEFSVVPGLMFNTENPDTNYRTGTEFHMDFMFNQFLSEDLALGIHGYAYKQLTGDSGSGALLGDFKGEALGIGPAISWIPKSAGGSIALSASWVHDVHSKNRLSGDYGALSFSIQF